MYHKPIQLHILRLRPGGLALIALAQRLDNLVHHRRLELSARTGKNGAAGHGMKAGATTPLADFLPHGLQRSRESP